MNIRTKRAVEQFARYLVGAVGYFWSVYLVFAVCYSMFHWNWLPAKMLADAVGWTLNYLVQRYWAFASKQLQHHEGMTIGKYTALTFLNFFIDYAIVGGLKSLGISPYIGMFVSAGFFTAWNYLWYRFWVFYGKRSGDAKEAA